MISVRKIPKGEQIGPPTFYIFIVLLNYPPSKLAPFTMRRYIVVVKHLESEGVGLDPRLAS